MTDDTREKPVPTMLRMPRQMRDRVDELRGDVPREAWIRRLIQAEIDRQNSSPSA